MLGPLDNRIFAIMVEFLTRELFIYLILYFEEDLQ